jgi:hypothetical protein
MIDRQGQSRKLKQMFSRRKPADPMNWKVVGIVLATSVLILVLWKLPQIQASHAAGETKNQFDRENAARLTIAQIIGGLLVIATLYTTAKSYGLARQGQITDRFTKAIEQLGTVDSMGKAKIQVRLGGLYALERIARDSERDHSVISVFSARVRDAV